MIKREYIRKAQSDDLNRILELYHHARIRMAKNGNPDQWGTTHPAQALIEEDIKLGRSYVFCKDGIVCGVFCLMFGEDPTYQIIQGKWSSAKEYVTVHRIAGEGGGVFKACVEYASKLSDYIRVDTHEKNTAMRRAIENQGFHYCGVIWVEDGSPRVAFDLLVNSHENA